MKITAIERADEPATTLGVIGLGIMGGAMAEALLAAGFAVCGYDPAAAASRRLKRAGGRAADIQMKLNAALNTVLADQTIRSRLGEMGVVAVGGAPDVLPRQIRVETESLRKIAADAKLKFH